ncbi:hypothetical protein Lalb_Chr10g0094431 [Lupinus albus]|uniref:Uncharacterized protein n=1 Tax=Lupinus albus TaxID=3870 RepID=A0A6A4PUV3_LUPAL|nr:hypothetical protein Lalb_Chr10g0094431 [Lupinus albus]
MFSIQKCYSIVYKKIKNILSYYCFLVVFVSLLMESILTPVYNVVLKVSHLLNLSEKPLSSLAS